MRRAGGSDDRVEVGAAVAGVQRFAELAFQPKFEHLVPQKIHQSGFSSTHSNHVIVTKGNKSPVLDESGLLGFRETVMMGDDIGYPVPDAGVATSAFPGVSDEIPEELADTARFELTPDCGRFGLSHSEHRVEQKLGFMAPAALGAVKLGEIILEELPTVDEVVMIPRTNLGGRHTTGIAIPGPLTIKALAEGTGRGFRHLAHDGPDRELRFGPHTPLYAAGASFSNVAFIRRDIKFQFEETFDPMVALCRKRKIRLEDSTGESALFVSRLFLEPGSDGRVWVDTRP
jgi:hypothetical protein